MAYLNTYEVINDRARRHPDRVALIFLEDGTTDGQERSFSYQELRDDIVRAANMLAQLGVGRTDAVTLMLPNGPEAQVAMWAAESVGIANPVNGHLSLGQLAHILNAAGTKVLVVQGPSEPAVWEKAVELRDLVPSLGCILAVDGTNDVALGWHSRISSQTAGRLQFPAPRPSDIASYFHTGGTTGTPKLAQHTHGNEVFNSAAIVDVLGWSRYRSSAMALPMFHVVGAIAVSLGAFTSGMTLVVLGPLGFRNRTAVARIWETVDRHDIEVLVVVPTVMSAILETSDHGRISRTLAQTVSGSAPVPIALAQRWERTVGHRPLGAYGLTEGTCASALTPPGGPVKAGSVGRSLPGCEIRIVDHDLSGTEPSVESVRETGEPGLVLTRGPNIFPGYKVPRRDAGVLLDGGWLNTGDIGYVDGDGDLWITGRAKDLIKRSGHGIDPSEVEEGLARHPAVTMAAVVGRPDAYAGEVPIAFVQVRHDLAAPEVAEELRLWCKERVGDPAAAPVQVVAVSELPMTGVGKISKVELRRRAARLAIELEIAGIVKNSRSAYALELHDEGTRFVGRVVTSSAPADLAERIRYRLSLLSVPTVISVESG
ncbi:AMP-binding protein [Pseudonocardia spinosispora]|uniref:AMP-binding protein n=1 Tax=Pseudonocardia spinosispora TaxID=103441 RepID=UPI0003FF83D9|nr:AMP-binding protein [Pseudonocardia spinosispora]